MIEVMAEEVHNLWLKWASKIMSQEKLSKKRVKRWTSCFVPYSNLTEGMKDTDRRIARKFLRILNKGDQ